MEAGAGLVDPEYQRAGLFCAAHAARRARVALQAGHRYILGACEDDLFEMYRSMGFSHLETRQVTPKAGVAVPDPTLIYLDLDRIVSELPFGEMGGRKWRRSSTSWGRDRISIPPNPHAA